MLGKVLYPLADVLLFYHTCIKHFRPLKHFFFLSDKDKMSNKKQFSNHCFGQIIQIMKQKNPSVWRTLSNVLYKFTFYLGSPQNIFPKSPKTHQDVHWQKWDGPLFSFFFVSNWICNSPTDAMFTHSVSYFRIISSDFNSEVCRALDVILGSFLTSRITYWCLLE